MPAEAVQAALALIEGQFEELHTVLGTVHAVAVEADHGGDPAADLPKEAALALAERAEAILARLRECGAGTRDVLRTTLGDLGGRLVEADRLRAALGISHQDALALADHPDDEERASLIGVLETHSEITTYPAALDYSRRERMPWTSDMALATYQTAGFTPTELDAIDEYREQIEHLGLRPYFDLDELLAESGSAEVRETALHQRAEKLNRWHGLLATLLTDPRLENERRRGTPGPSFDPRGEGPYCAAVAYCLRTAAEDYHRHRQGFEYAVTVRALGEQVSDGYPAESRHLDLRARSLKLWS
ncbi:hypothetical protein ACIBEA_43160 [Streptomyces sp. NPDC051555]|uniref:hypothetical protein n=1 Tax=Streptomyces sp. NPDC051555 TaxID=3365657 RepID=UPI0037AA14AA